MIRALIKNFLGNNLILCSLIADRLSQLYTNNSLYLTPKYARIFVVWLRAISAYEIDIT